MADNLLVEVPFTSEKIVVGSLAGFINVMEQATLDRVMEGLYQDCALTLDLEIRTVKAQASTSTSTTNKTPASVRTALSALAHCYM